MVLIRIASLARILLLLRVGFAILLSHLVGRVFGLSVLPWISRFRMLGCRGEREWLLLDSFFPKLVSTGCSVSPCFRQQDAARPFLNLRVLLLGGLGGWGLRELQALSLTWYVGVAESLRKVEDNGVWPAGLLDAFSARIPQSEGDDAHLGQRPLLCSSCPLSSLSSYVV